MEVPTIQFTTDHGPLTLRFASPTHVHVTTRTGDDEAPLSINRINYRLWADLKLGERGWDYAWNAYRLSRSGVGYGDDATQAARTTARLILSSIGIWLARGDYHDQLAEAAAYDLEVRINSAHAKATAAFRAYNLAAGELEALYEERQANG